MDLEKEAQGVPLSGVLDNRYRILRMLGSGGMGAVYLVEDLLQENRRKALKILPSSMNRPETLDRLESEFEILAKLSHPNLEKVYDFAHDTKLNLSYFTAEYVQGEDLGQAGPGLRPLQLANLAVQVLRALAYLHSRRIIHFDVKPANIIVSEDRSTVKLIDFGLAGGHATERFGTPGFIAPEIVRGTEVDLRADLYALGVTLYQVVAGRPPFVGDTTLTTVRQQMSKVPAPPSSLNPDVPKPLEDIILRLMARDPSGRYANAWEVIDALNRGLGMRHEIETPETAERYLLTPSFVGRKKDLEWLKDLFQRSMEPGPADSLAALVVLEGPQGVGKGRICRELRWHAQLRRTSFISFDAQGASASDFACMAGAVRQVLAAVGPDDPARGRHGPAITDLLLGHPGQMADPAHGEGASKKPTSPQRLFETVARFFVEVSLRRPLVVFSPDLHTMGVESANFLGHLARLLSVWRREGDPAGSGLSAESRPHMMLLATAEPHALSKNGPVTRVLDALDDLAGLESREISDLAPDDVQEMVASVLGAGPDTEALSTILFAEIGGNPLAVVEALRFLFAEGALSPALRGWTVDLDAVKKPGGIPTAARAMAVRTGRLPPERRKVLDVLAVLDEGAGITFLADLAQADRTVLYRHLKDLEAEGFVSRTPDPGEPRFRLAHPRLREEIYQAVPGSERTRLHARAGAYIEASLTGDGDAEAWGRIAVHFFRAGNGARAKKYASRAAEHFTRLRLHDGAVRFLRIVFEASTDPCVASALRLASALYQASRYRHAVDLLEEVLGSASGPDEALLLHQSLARSYAGMGLYAEALRNLSEVRDRLGPETPEPRYTSYITLSADIHTHVGQYDRARELCEEGLSRLGSDGPLQQKVRVLDGLAFLYRLEGDLSGSMAVQKQIFEITESLDDPLLGFQSADGLGVIHFMLGNFRESLRWGRRAIRIALQTEDLQAQSTAFGNLAMTYTSLGRLTRAFDYFTRANLLAERIGDLHKLGVSFFNIANVLDGLGRFSEGTGPYVRSIELSQKAGDRMLASMAQACFAWHHLLLWDPSAAKRALDQAKSGADEVKNRSLTAMIEEVHAHLASHQGDQAQALAHLISAIETYETLEHVQRLVDVRLHQGRILVALGAFEEAERALTAVADAAQRRGFLAFQAETAVLQGELSLLRNRVAEGESRLREGARLYMRMGAGTFASRALLRLAASLAGRGRSDDARALLAQARPVVEEVGGEELRAEHDYVQGLLALNAREGSGAVRSLEKARDAAVRARAADLTCRASLALGHAHLSAKSPDAARVCFEAVESSFVRMEEGLPLERVESLRHHPYRTIAAETLAGLSPGPVRSERLEEPKPEEASWEKGPVPRESLESLERLVEEAGDKEHAAHLDAIRAGFRDVLRLFEVIALLGREHVLNTVLSTVLDTAMDLTGAHRGFIILADDWSGDLRLEDLSVITARNFDREEVRTPEFKISRSVAWEAGRTGRSVLIGDAAMDPRLGEAGSVQRLRLRSVVCVPLHEPRRVLGVLYLDNRFEADAFSLQHLALLESLAQQAAVAVAHARLYRGILNERLRVEELNARLGELNRELQETVKTQILEIGDIRRSLGEKTREISLRFSYDGIVGRSKAMEKLFWELDRIIDTDMPVLVTGPTGSGKELVVKTIHYQSSRKAGRLVSENCAAVPESLLESELFGSVRGAFTGATEDRKGLLELADGGTLFLDEIGDMSPGMQSKLLRSLEGKEIRRVGSEKTLPVDFRLITATNQDLARAVEEGTFRKELYFRLNTCTVHVPALAKRREDIGLLTEHFLEYFAEVKGVSVPVLPKPVMDALVAYDWPGNVRELKNEIERLVAMSQSGRITKGDLSAKLRHKARTRTPTSKEPAVEDENFNSVVARFEIEFLRKALEENDWNVVQTARQLGINRMKLNRKMKKYELKKDIE